MSSIALLGVPSEMYVYGTLYATIVVSYPICMAITARFYMPVFHDLGVISSFEVLFFKKRICAGNFSAFLFFLCSISSGGSTSTSASWGSSSSSSTW